MNSSEETHAGSGPPADTSGISVNSLSKTYGDGEEAVTAVSGIDFEIQPGTAVGILGPNGAGKTTTIKCTLGLIEPTDGTVHVGDIDVSSDPKAAYRRIGATFEGARNMYWRLTVEENLEFFAALAGNDPRERADRHQELLEQFNIADKADTAVRDLSRGQKQKATLACALARDADFLFLDEPTLGLDVESKLELQRELRNLVEHDDTTLLLSSHDMDVIEEVCDRVIIMNDGEIVADDSVDALVNLFDTTQYEVIVDDLLGQSIRRDLERSFDASGFEERGTGKTRFVVSISDDEFYDLTGKLQDTGLTVEGMNTLDANLEEAFLVLTDDDSETTSETRSERTVAPAGGQR